jgi:polar amino acid transport system ATP-binding protein
MSDMLFKASHLKKSFGETEVLKDITVEVAQGEVVSILGPSGSGKSTFLRCATLLETMDGGSLEYEGKYAVRDEGGKAVYASGDELRKIRQSFGLVFQNFNLFPHYTALKNIMLSPVLTQKRNEEEVRKEAMVLLDKVGLSDKADAYPGQLSGGQKQRVAIARALAMNPKIIFFDEPTSALDPELTAGILRVLKDLAKEKMTMVIVTHEIQFAHDISDRVVFMADGNIIEQGRPQDVIDHPANQRTRDFLNLLTE